MPVEVSSTNEMRPHLKREKKMDEEQAAVTDKVS